MKRCQSTPHIPFALSRKRVGIGCPPLFLALDFSESQANKKAIHPPLICFCDSTILKMGVIQYGRNEFG
jgi:hypothetical protein